MKGISLKNTEGFMRKSDPFFELHRKIDSAGAATWDNVYRSETVNDNLSPQWNESALEVSLLCGGNFDLPLQVKVFDYESSGKHVLMGQFENSVNGLVALASSGAEVELKKEGKQTGKIAIQKADIVGGASASSIEQGMAKASISPMPAGAPTFVDYVSGGCELNVVVAIDFTGSNGDPRDPSTLHHFSSDGSKNDYEKAISSILSILSKYDHDNKFPVLGFGAKYDGVVQHAFQCGPTEEVHGVQGGKLLEHKVVSLL
jgi:hypothetical protein